jgi:hypothetical protein
MTGLGGASKEVVYATAVSPYLTVARRFRWATSHDNASRRGIMKIVRMMRASGG